MSIYRVGLRGSVHCSLKCNPNETLLGVFRLSPELVETVTSKPFTRLYQTKLLLLSQVSHR
ncbi:hypothetical protein I79_023718 [Cricetulus griseus]|uniref:Uncharacterized protein n=1 Tax=Cricetulus griseus TaxID=10029 RepID=G3IIP5_CRIGR|nr:hypothetical protein I79_023718 [Cricetulus griseus]